MRFNQTNPESRQQMAGLSGGQDALNQAATIYQEQRTPSAQILAEIQEDIKSGQGEPLVFVDTGQSETRVQINAGTLARSLRDTAGGRQLMQSMQEQADQLALAQAQKKFHQVSALAEPKIPIPENRAAPTQIVPGGIQPRSPIPRRSIFTRLRNFIS